MIFRKKKLFEEDPKTLDLEMLSHLQASLVAKLIPVNEELRRRYENISALSGEIPASEKPRTALNQGATRLVEFNAYLNEELNRIVGSDGGGHS